VNPKKQLIYLNQQANGLDQFSCLQSSENPTIKDLNCLDQLLLQLAENLLAITIKRQASAILFGGNPEATKVQLFQPLMPQAPLPHIPKAAPKTTLLLQPRPQPLAAVNHPAKFYSKIERK
jgi:hypothetical protein